MSEVKRMNWFALRVRTKCEDTVARALRNHGFEEFLPTYPERPGRRCGLQPYFPGYLFCKFSLESKTAVLRAPYVLEIVSLGRGPTEVPSDEIEALRKIVIAGICPAAHPYLSEGMKVRIVKGALQGLEGYVIRGLKGSRLVISVNLLMRSLCLEIDDSWVCSTPERHKKTSVTTPRLPAISFVREVSGFRRSGFEY